MFGRRPPVSAEGCSIASGRDTIIEGNINLGPSAADLQAIIEDTLSAPELLEAVRAAAQGGAVEGNERVRELSDQLNLRQDALARMFGILEREQVPAERLADLLA